MLIDCLTILFWLSVISILHTYLFFPLLVKIIGSGKSQNAQCYKPEESPFVSIIIAAHNEEHVIEHKLLTTFSSDYPRDQYEVLIAADSCTDNTIDIIKSFTTKHTSLQLFEFNERKGKSHVVNELVKKAKGDYLILTDANVFFEPQTIFELLKHYKNESIGQVGGNIVNTNLKNTGISIPEKNYLDIEKEIKFNEGKIWGTMIGAFGGCYSIRKELFKEVPDGFLMDDFYISMAVLDQNCKAIFEPKAICFEDVSDKISEEFRRKVRISAGNFQNLFAYKRLLFKPNSGLIFSFISHKVLRWKTPFFILMMLSISYFLGQTNKLYTQLFYFQLLLFVPLCLDLVLRSVKVHVKFLRFVTHFYSMNLALLVGFFKYLGGVKTNVWKPTERNQ